MQIKLKRLKLLTIICFYFQAKECLQKAISFKRHEISYVMLGKIFLMESNIPGAIEVYKQAVE